MEQVSCLDIAALVAVPVFPNSVRWSQENLLAAAAGHLVTILDPSSLGGPRGYITLPPNSAKDIGEISDDDATKPSVFPIRLRKETQRQVRSIDWSPQGFGPDAGCLLAVCTSAHDVRIFRRPTSELTSEWVEVANVSALHHAHCMATSFADAAPIALEYAKGDTVTIPEVKWQFRKGWQTAQTQLKKPRAQAKLAGPSKTKPKAVAGKSAQQVALNEVAGGEIAKAEEADGRKAEGEQSTIANGSGEVEVHTTDTGAGSPTEGGAAQSKTGLLQGGSVGGTSEVAAEFARQRLEPESGRTNDSRLGSSGSGPAFQNEEVGLGKKNGGAHLERAATEGSEGTREGLGGGTEIALDGQRKEKLRPRGGKAGARAEQREEADGEDPFGGECLSGGVKRTDMLLGLETGEPERLGAETGAGEEVAAGGSGEVFENSTAGGQANDSARKEGEGAGGVNQEGGLMGADSGTRVDEKGVSRRNRGKKRGRDTESEQGDGPQVAERKSTRKAARSNGLSQEAKGGAEPDAGTGMAGGNKEKRSGRHSDPQLERKVEAAAEGRAAVIAVDEAARPLVQEPGVGSTVGTETEGRNCNEADGGKQKETKEEGSAEASLPRVCNEAETTPKRRENEDNSAPEDVPVSSLRKLGRCRASRAGSPAATGPGDPSGNPREEADPAPEEGSPSWRLGTASGPVLCTDAVGVGSRVEVLQLEEGLRGAWFSATVVGVSGRQKARVEYDELLENEETGEKLREWIPLPPVATVGIGGLAPKSADKPTSRKRTKVTTRRKKKDEGGKKAADGEAEKIGTSKTQVRPRVRPEVSRVDKVDRAYVVGDHVEASLDDAWWEGLVVGCTPEGAISVYFPDGDVQKFEAGKLRLAWEYKNGGRGWAPFGSTVLDRFAKPGSRRRATRRVKDEPAEGTLERRGKKGVKAGGKKVSEGRKHRKSQTPAEPLTTGGLKLPKVEDEDGYDMSTLGPEERARLVREHERLAGVLCERFRVLREKEPAGSLPEYQEKEHLKGRDRDILEQVLAEMVADEGDQLVAARLTVKELVKLGRRHIRQKLIGTRGVKPRAEVKHSPAKGAQLGPRKRKRHDYSKLGGGEDRDEDETAEPIRKRKRKKKEAIADEEDFKGSESGSDSDVPVAARKKKRKRGAKVLSESATEKKRKQDRAKAQKKRDSQRAAREEAKRLAKAKREHGPGSELVPAATFAARSDLLAALTVAWSPACDTGAPSGAFSVLAVGSMSGHVALWRVAKPLEYGAADAGPTSVTLLGTVLAHDSWVSALGWVHREGPARGPIDAEDMGESGQGSALQGPLVLVTGSSDGSVRLWSVAAEEPANGGAPLGIHPAGEVCPPTGEVVSSLSARRDGDVIKVAVAEGAGQLLLWQGPVSTGGATPKAPFTPTVASARPSGQPLVGLGWAAGGEEAFTCSQEGNLQRWQLDGVNSPLPVTLQLTAGERQFGLSVPTPSMMRGYTGLALSPNGLAIAGVRTLALGRLDTMYQAKAMRGALQVALCGRGAAKPGLGKRPPGKLSATAEAAIRALTEGREKRATGKDWLDEFLLPPAGDSASGEPSQIDKEKGKETEEGGVQKSEGKAVGGDSRAEDERRRSSAERLTREVVLSVERILQSEGPLVLWDVVAALRELGADALRQVLAVVRRAAWGKEPRSGVGLRGAVQSTLEEGSGPGGEEGSARKEDTGWCDNDLSEGRAERVVEPGRDVGKSDEGEVGIQKESGSSSQLRGETALPLQSKTAASGSSSGDDVNGSGADRAKRRALQVLHVLLLKLGASLAAAKEPPLDAENRASGSECAGTEPSTRGKSLEPALGLADQRSEPGGNELEAELKLVRRELRTRLAGAVLARLRECPGPVTGPFATSALLWADWAQAEGRGAGPRLQQLAEDLFAVCRERPPSDERSPVPREACPLCSSPVPLDSPDTAHCLQTGLPSTSARPGVKGHKFKRCMVTMLVQSSAASWQCSCCRGVCEQAPVDSGGQPLCGLCGVLMHRPLPEPFLQPALC